MRAAAPVRPDGVTADVQKETVPAADFPPDLSKPPPPVPETKPAKRAFSTTDLDFGSHLTKGEKESICGLLDRYDTILSKHESDIGRTNLVKHTIDTGDAAPINLHPYRLSFSERKEVKDMVNEYLDEGIIRESDSPWSCPIILI